MPCEEAPLVVLGSAPETPHIAAMSPSPSEASTASPAEPQFIQPTPLFRTLAIPPPEPDQPPGQEDLERRLPGYRRIVIPREMTLIEILKQEKGLTDDEEVLQITDVRLKVVAERVGLRRLSVLVPKLRSLTLDGSALNSLRELGIDLIHLKFLSVNRCGLNCLDGIWGLSSLHEFHAANNKIEDLHPIGALQKLHTLNLAENPIKESVRLWMLAVCPKLRKLTLRGTPISGDPDYHNRVFSALPNLIYLDDRLLDDIDEPTEEAIADSESEVDEEPKESKTDKRPTTEPEPGPSRVEQTEIQDHDVETQENYICQEIDEQQIERQKKKLSRLRLMRQRPATTENAGVRPKRVELPRRPKTALERPTIDGPSRMQILNTLIDEEWRCSGSKLTSHGAVCGNLAWALRRPNRRHRSKDEEELEMLEKSIEKAARGLAMEIPRAPLLEDWEKFRKDTGIEININFDERPKGVDAIVAIERLEEIERETSERLRKISNGEEVTSTPPMRFVNNINIMNDYEQWKDMNIGSIPHPSDINKLFTGILSSDVSVDSREGSLLDEHIDCHI